MFIYLPLSQSPPCLQSWRSCLSTLGAAEEKCVSPIACHIAHVARHSLTVFPFPWWRDCHQLVQPYVVSPWGRSVLTEFLLHSPMHLNSYLYFMLQSPAEISSWQGWPSTNYLSSMSTCLNQYSSGFLQLWPRGLRADSLVLLVPQLALRSVCLLPMRPPQSFGIRYWIWQLRHRCFRLWMDV